MTAERFVGICGQAVGYTTASIDQRLSLYAIANAAGRAVVSKRDWTWRIRRVANGRPIEVAAVAGKEFVEAPLDFGGIVACRDTRGARVRATSLQEIDEARRLGPEAWDGCWLVCFDQFEAPRSGVSLARPIWDIWPTPTEDGNPTLMPTYRARWLPISEADPNAICSVDDAAEHYLVLVGRAFAKCIVKGEEPYEDEAAEREYARLVREDQSTQTFRGTVQGAVGSSRYNAMAGWPPEKVITW